MDIKKLFWDAFKNREPVQLMNRYQGLPVTCGAVVIMLGRDVLALKVEPRCLVAIRHERHTYLDCGDYPEWLKAFPIAFEMQERMVVLDRFGVVNSASRRRYYELRIQPKETVSVVLDSASQQAAGRLLDLQTGENSSLCLRIAVDGVFEIQRDSRIGLALVIPDARSATRLQGTATRVNHQNRSGFTRLQIHVLIEPAAEELFSFFNRRKEEIEAEWLAA
jgi:hypothetical protein